MQSDAVREVLENFDEVRLAYLFGSVAAGTAQPASDLDVAVLLTPGTGSAVVDRLIEALERASCRAVDLVDLSLAPPLLAPRGGQAGKLILSRDEAERVEFETRAVARYLARRTCAKSSTSTYASAWRPAVPLRAEVVRKKLLQIEQATARLASLSGFRNILVHDYAEIDLTKILAGLDRLDDFDASVADVERWLQQASSG